MYIGEERKVLNSIITILLIIILSPVILIAGVIVLSIAICLIIGLLMSIFLLLVEISEIVGNVIQKISNFIKRKINKKSK